MAGKQNEATKSLAELMEISKRRFVTRGSRRLIYAGLGHKEQAFAWLEKAYNEHNIVLTCLRVDSRFDSLRPDPRVADLLRRVGLAARNRCEQDYDDN